VIETQIGMAAPSRWRPDRATWILLGGNALSSTGAGFFFPILPIFASARGASSFEVGAMLTAGVAGSALAQFPGGWLADRYDRRRLVVLFQLIYGAFFPLYLLPVSPLVFIPLRFLHTLLTSGYQPTALALLTDLSPARERGRVFGYWSSSYMAGFLLGPAVGGFLAAFNLDYAFLGAAAVSLLTAGTMLFLPRPARHVRAVEPDDTPTWGLIPILLPAMLAAAGTAYGIGCYDAVWSLYVHSLGGSPFVIGLSFTLFALPVLVLSSVAGGLSDRIGPKPVVLWSTLAMGAFGTAYGFIHNIPAIVLLGVVEGSTVIGGRPALLALVSRSVPESRQGRAQGTFQTSAFVFQSVGSLVGGALFGVQHAFAFISIGAACWLAALAVPRLGRRSASL
jgi:DHA1 family multidrug resistance protein-like MFS transporter